MYARSNELEEKGVINLNAVNIESNPDMETLLGVSVRSLSSPSTDRDILSANRKGSPLPSSPLPTRTLLPRLAPRSFNRGPVNLIPHACWSSQQSARRSLPIHTHPHTIFITFQTPPSIFPPCSQEATAIHFPSVVSPAFFFFRCAFCVNDPLHEILCPGM